MLRNDIGRVLNGCVGGCLLIDGVACGTDPIGGKLVTDRLLVVIGFYRRVNNADTVSVSVFVSLCVKRVCKPKIERRDNTCEDIMPVRSE